MARTQNIYSVTFGDAEIDLLDKTVARYLEKDGLEVSRSSLIRRAINNEYGQQKSE